MPFTSKAQERAAFGGYLGKEMKGKAKEWADETKKKLPLHAKGRDRKKQVEAIKKNLN